jgi:hypothetical protein
VDAAAGQVGVAVSAAGQSRIIENGNSCKPAACMTQEHPRGGKHKQRHKELQVLTSVGSSRHACSPKLVMARSPYNQTTALS